jgi:hypothetical protein
VKNFEGLLILVASRSCSYNSITEILPLLHELLTQFFYSIYNLLSEEQSYNNEGPSWSLLPNNALELEDNQVTHTVTSAISRKKYFKISINGYLAFKGCCRQWSTVTY